MKIPLLTDPPAVGEGLRSDRPRTSSPERSGSAPGPSEASRGRMDSRVRRPATSPRSASTAERRPDLLDVVEVMMSPACHVVPEADTLVAPRNPTDAVAVVGRHRGAKA